MGLKNTCAPNLDEIEVNIFGPSFGESLAIHYGNGNWIIVDSCVSATTKNPVAMDYLERIGVDISSAVKLVVITHWHSDHIAGIQKIVANCPEAKICVPASFTREDFIKFLGAYNDPTQSVHGNGVDEIVGVFSLLNDRPRALAIADKRILLDCMQINQKDITCEIWALSPSDLAVTEALAQLGALMPKESETKRRATPTGKNDHSIVLHISVGEISILLGADLEETAHPDSGWTAIVNSTSRPTTKASVFKVPHHGSQNGHSDEVWNTLLVDEPVAVVTPYNKGKKLPASSDMKRLNGLTNKLFLTALPLSRQRLKQERFVEKVMKDFGVKTYVDVSEIGHIRCQKLIDNSNNWHVTQNPIA